MTARAVMGLETELGYTIRTPTGFVEATIDDVRGLLRGVATRLGPAASAKKAEGHFTANGSLVYLDYNQHPELVTAECTRPSEVVALDRALRNAATDTLVELALPERRPVAFINNRDLGTDPTSYGCHENYQVSKFHDEETSIGVDEYVDAVLLHLATRTIYTGAGFYGPRGGDQFAISQRAEFLVYDAKANASHTTLARPFVDTRDESLTSTPDKIRLHVTSGETNLLETPTYLKIGTTSILLAMIEDGWRPSLAFTSISAANTALMVSLDPTLERVLPLSKPTRAVDVQWSLLEAATRWCRTHPGEPFGDPGEVARVLDTWQRVLWALDSNIASAAGLVDWVARRAFVESWSARNDAAPARKVLLSLRLDEIPTPGSPAEIFRRQSGIETIVTEATVRTAATAGPPGTRAHARGACITILDPYVSEAAWESVTLDVPGSRAVVVDLGASRADEVPALRAGMAPDVAIETIAHWLVARARARVERAAGEMKLRELQEMADDAARLVGRTTEIVELARTIDQRAARMQLADTARRRLGPRVLPRLPSLLSTVTARTVADRSLTLGR